MRYRGMNWARANLSPEQLAEVEVAVATAFRSSPRGLVEVSAAPYIGEPAAAATVSLNGCIWEVVR